MKDWIDNLYGLAVAGEAAVVVSVVAIRGSSPREAGAKMIVTAAECNGSIGGGQLEFQCAGIAAGLLGQDEQILLRKFVLGASLGQCCGGTAEILFEPVANGVPHWLEELHNMDVRMYNAVLATFLSGDKPRKTLIRSLENQAAYKFSKNLLKAVNELLDHGGEARVVEDVFLEPITTSDLNIAVFGAGHVGSALVATLAGLDAHIHWIDSRAGVFQHLPKSVRAVQTESPVQEVSKLPPSSFYLVMTHSHQLDLEICAAILARNDAAYCGLIGSVSKRRRFEKQFRQLGLSQAHIDRLVCPIGIDGISGKRPKEIAIAVAAEVLQYYDRVRATRGGIHV